MASVQRKILVLTSQAFSLLQFRLDMMKAFQSKGYEVHAAAPGSEAEWCEKLAKNNIVYHAFPMDRNGENPLNDVRSYRAIKRLICQVKPDYIFAYQAKTVIYGSLAAYRCGIKQVYVLIAGLGSVLRKTDHSLSRKLVRYILGIQYRFALKIPKKVFFQNHDDAIVLVGKRLVDFRKLHFLNGSGVNLDHFKHTALPREKRLLFIGRLIGDKGILEYLEAASIVKRKHPEAVFDVVGYYDTNPSAIQPETLEKYFQNGIAVFHGMQHDVYPYIARCFCLVLPSYHEGTPKSVLEAMAVGRPVITTDAPGCRETVIDGLNGYLVPVADVDTLAKRMIDMVENKDDVAWMANNSRNFAVSRYDVHKVNKVIVQEMGL